MTLNPLQRGLDLASRVLASINDDPPPPRPMGAPGVLGALVAWVDLERDSRGITIRIAIDSLTGDPVYAVEALAVDLDCAFHGAGRTLQSAACAALASIHNQQEDPPCP